jgi:hypothetical protein
MRCKDIHRLLLDARGLEVESQCASNGILISLEFIMISVVYLP